MSPEADYYSKWQPKHPEEALARPASLPSANAEPNVIVADALAIRRDEDDAADQVATLSGLVHASVMLVQLDKVVEACAVDRRCSAPCRCGMQDEHDLQHTPRDANDEVHSTGWLDIASSM